MTEVIAMVMTMEDDTYYAIVDALALEDAEGYPLYSVEQIAEMYGTTVEAVQYIDQVEFCDC